MIGRIDILKYRQPGNRRHLARVIRIACVIGTVILAPAASFGDDAVPFGELRTQYKAVMLPLLTRFCLDCHSTETKEGELDLERFSTLENVRRDPKAWQKVVEMLDNGEMPPEDELQPSVDEKKQIRGWARRYLDAEARAGAGDPGPVVLRRLNNAEFTYTIRDLTQVDLDPARDFPVDGAAGEGFTNTGNSLVMSPSLVTKYLEAAKDIASHMVLLPDGIRFSAGTTRRDWVDEILHEIRARYVSHTSGDSDVSALDHWGVADPLKVTDNDGKVDLAKYMTALVRHRERLRDDLSKVGSIAESEHLNAKYLGLLAKMLVSGEPKSALLDAIRDRWRHAEPDAGPAVAAEIRAWQDRLWKYNAVGHFGSIQPWLAPAVDLPDAVTLKQAIAPEPSRDDVVLYLVAGDGGDGGKDDLVVWRQPRIEFKARKPVLLRDVGPLTRQIKQDVTSQLAKTDVYLAAVAELQSTDATLETIASQRDLDVGLLACWTEYLGVGYRISRTISGRFGKKLTKAQGYESVNGWGTGATPNLLANSSDQAVSFLTLTIPPRGVTVHPSPSQSAAVAWQSPIDGPVVIRGKVADADDKCGNGAAWTLELRNNSGRVVAASGTIDNGKSGQIEVKTPVVLRKGDTISLVVSARDGDHGCDTTHIELTISEQEGQHRIWDLAADVVDSIHAGNPHTDSYGNPKVWHFYSTSGEPKQSAAVVPPGSALARWKEAVLGSSSGEELDTLAASVQEVLTLPEASRSESDRTMIAELNAWDGPLDWLSRVRVPTDEAAHATPPEESSFGIDAARFGRHPSGAEIDAGSFVSQAPEVIEVRLPAAMVRGGEFVVEGALDANSGEDGSVQLQLLSERPDHLPNQAAGVPIVTRAEGESRRRLAAAHDDFRQLFPAAMCYARIVPVDVVVTLVLFHREDDHLSRLMLDDAQRSRMNRLWDELHYVSQDALTEVTAFEQLMEFATQDDNPARFEPLRESIQQRAADLRLRLLETETVHVDALLDFASRAYRRPLTTTETDGLRRFYNELRAAEMNHDESIRLLLVRVLSSPAFLYRLEKPGPGKHPTPVSDSELAVRLSYFLWSSLPDARLNETAAAGRLRDPDVLVAESRRMLKGTRTRRLAIQFACQWLHIRDFDQHDEKSARHFPQFVGLRADMYEESIRFFEHLFRHDGSFLDILDADHTFLNEALAAHYGIPGVKGAEWRLVEGVKQFSRGGVLAQATTLARQSGASRTSPILRGNWVAETLLGERLPRPPKGVPKLPEGDAATENLTMRQLVGKHTADVTCAKCHQRIDPYGFALERFDAIGRFREKDGGDRPIDTRTTLMDGTKIEGIEGLRTYLLTTRRATFVGQFCRKLLGYALGRGVQLSDEPLLAEMAEKLEKDGYRFSTAVETIVRSRQFREIRGKDASNTVATLGN